MTKHPSSSHRVTREEAREEAAALADSSGRSRWIIGFGVAALLALGAWVIAQRVMPYVWQQRAAEAVTGLALPADAMPTEEMPPAMMMGAPDAAPMTPGAAPQVRSAKGVAAVANVATADTAVRAERKVQKTGQMAIVVKDLDGAVDAVQTIAQDAGGDVVSVQIATTRTRAPRTATVRLRVPVAQFDDVRKAVRTRVAVEVRSEAVYSEDVTTAVVDLDARLANKRREEEAIAKILERAGKMDDVLKVTRELARVRGEIERLSAQQRAMARRTTYATLTITLREDVKVDVKGSAERPGAVARESLNRLAEKVRDMINFAIRFLTFFLPAFFLYVIILIVLWKILKRIGMALMRRMRRTHRAGAEEGAPTAPTNENND